MNYISADSFVIAYPALTLKNQGVMHSRALSAKDVRAMSKFCQRGYPLREALYLWRGQHECVGTIGECSSSVRRFGDEGSLGITWREPERQLDPLNWNVEWILGGEPCGGYCTEHHVFWIADLL